MKKQRINNFLSTLNFVLFFVGFQFVTSLFLPVGTDMDRAILRITLPYRAFALFVSISVIIINIKRINRRLSISLILFLFYWAILIIRMIYDIYIRTDIHITNVTQLWLYVFGICMPAIFSIFQSYKNIDLNKAFWWVLFIASFTLILNVYLNPTLFIGSIESNEREVGNAAMSTIAFGHFAATCIILGVYTLLYRNLKIFAKVLVVIMIILGFFCMLRTGSRGPVMALAVVLLFWLFSRSKNLSWGIIMIFIVSLLSLLFINQLLSLIGNISPFIEDRLRVSIFEGNTGGRDPYYETAINLFKDSPIIGKQFVLFLQDGTYDYAHNIILDALMGLGVVGAGLLISILASAFKKSYNLIKNNDPHFWIYLILIQQIMFNMVSGAFYYNQLLSVLLTFLFLQSGKMKLPQKE